MQVWKMLNAGQKEADYWSNAPVNELWKICNVSQAEAEYTWQQYASAKKHTF